MDTHDVPGGLDYLAELLGCAGALLRLPEVAVRAVRTSTKKLTPDQVCAAIAAAQPEDTILVDESLTTGGRYWELSQNCPSFSHLTLTGGAIGQGPPLAVGAAVACPDRRVINFQADGSGLYSAQALWTQAHEKLLVTTVVCVNNVYNILKIEQDKQKLPRKGAQSTGLTDLSGPNIDWVKLANGFGVEAVAVTDYNSLLTELRRGLEMDGPFLIAAML